MADLWDLFAGAVNRFRLDSLTHSSTDNAQKRISETTARQKEGRDAFGNLLYWMSHSSVIEIIFRNIDLSACATLQ